MATVATKWPEPSKVAIRYCGLTSWTTASAPGAASDASALIAVRSCAPTVRGPSRTVAAAPSPHELQNGVQRATNSRGSPLHLCGRDSAARLHQLRPQAQVDNHLAQIDVEHNAADAASRLGLDPRRCVVGNHKAGHARGQVDDHAVGGPLAHGALDDAAKAEGRSLRQPVRSRRRRW